ncbi:protocadherin alpha-13-like [Pyrgilauda ruficollis]|uniref:protocadherin alpha-13-like n=1 Tax=Pyrgilauda ruficollis TaxID=221976 RepID=UPI001B87E46C|nr:protocadherin alpha-13-like [Pyrgilauda ruficollis]
MGERCCAAVLRVLVLLQAAWALAGGQVRYSVPEEAKAGTVVGRLAQDLGLEAGEAEARRLRLVAQGRRASVEVSGASGALLVSSRLDREELCGKSAPCALRLEVLLERPLRVFHVQLEVTDINDNAPVFPAARKNLSLSENSPPGIRFPLEGATDADIGANAQLSYTLSPSEYFSLDLQKSYERNIVPELVLTKSLDRETIPVHRLVLTASDGGRPSLTGTMELVISVLDANDNAPQFNQSVYKVQLPENSTEGTLLARVNATDVDEGINSEMIYTATSFIPPSGKDVVSVNPNTGELHLTAALDFEEVSVFEFRIEATDQGTPPLSGHCRSSSSSLSRSAVGVELGPGAASAATNVWLVVAICAVSSLFLLAVVLYGASRWAPRAAVLSGPGPTTLVCASEVGSWSYSQRHSRSLCVADGAAKSDLMVFSPNFPPPPPPGPAPKDTQPEPSALLGTVSGPSCMVFSAPFHPPS